MKITTSFYKKLINGGGKRDCAKQMASERTKKNEPKGKVLAVLHLGRKQIREYLFVGLAPLRRAAYVALERK